MKTKKGEFTKEEDEYYMSVLQAVACGIRLRKPIEEILADVRQAPSELKGLAEMIAKRNN